jgi:hypothetical protein
MPTMEQAQEMLARKSAPAAAPLLQDIFSAWNGAYSI